MKRDELFNKISKMYKKDQIIKVKAYWRKGVPTKSNKKSKIEKKIGGEYDQKRLH